jgi:phage virion morphogenesis protein
MAGASITLESAQVDNALAKLLAAADDITPALKNIGEYEAKVTRGRFISKQDPNGNPWKALNPLYALTKKGPGILVGETRSLSQIVWQLAGDGVEIGSNEIYSRIHNEGGTIRPKTAAALVFSMGGHTFLVQKVTIPKRQFLGFSTVDEQEILGIVSDHFAEAIGEN